MKFKEIQKMGKKDLDKKMKELRVELVKSKATASKTGSARTKEIKKIIARILTFNKAEKSEELKNK